MASAAGLTRGRAADFFGKSTYLRGCGRHTGVFDDAKPQHPRRGVGYWVVVDFDMNIIDFLVTLNVTVSRMINWRNTASQIGHTVTNKTGMAVTVVMHFSHTEIIQ
jgi:hypothetical protein